MNEKIQFLKTKLEELMDVLKKNKAGYLEICENIKTAETGKEQVKNNISKIEGSIEGIQFSISQVEELLNSSPEKENSYPDVKKAK